MTGNSLFGNNNNSAAAKKLPSGGGLFGTLNENSKKDGLTGQASSSLFGNKDSKSPAGDSSLFSNNQTGGLFGSKPA